VLLYIESGNRSKANECIQEYQEISKKTKNEVVQLHGSLAEAIYLKSSSRFIDKGQAQKKFSKLLKDAYNEEHPQNTQILPTSDKSFSFLVVYHLIELYIEEFKLTEDKKILQEAQQLVDNHIQSVHDQKFSPKLVELSLLKAKLFIVDGEIEKALVILEQTRQEANINNFHRLEEKVSFEINQINREFQKWNGVIKNISVKDRIEKVRLEEYLKAIQKFVTVQE
jgi:hypothetical protein